MFYQLLSQLSACHMDCLEVRKGDEGAIRFGEDPLSDGAAEQHNSS